MKTSITAQQTAFFTKNGYIEFEVPHALPKHREGRDLWRQDPELQNLLTRKLAPIALTLSGKPQLRLGTDQWLSAAELPKKSCTVKELFSIQGFVLGAIIAENPIQPAKKSPLGILPLPSKPENVLFFRTDLLLDWPHVKSDVYLALYALPNAVYIHNPKDPLTNSLKQLGYHFGDVLKNEFHPFLAK